MRKGNASPGGVRISPISPGTTEALGATRSPPHARGRVGRRTVLRALAVGMAMAFLPGSGHASTDPPATPSPWQRIPLEDGQGKALDPTSLDGRVVVVVNVASFCSYTPQYADLQSMWTRYRSRGLVVIGVPSNQFGNQEPGTDREIRNFCRSRYGVDFPLLAKQDVTGDTRSPLYAWLSASVDPARDVAWNFEKFVVNRTGKVVAHFGSHVQPTDERVTRTLEMALDGAL